MRKAIAFMVVFGAVASSASYAADPVRPAVTSYAVANAPLVPAGARVGAPVSDGSNLAGGTPIILGVLAAGAAGAGIYAGVHHNHNHASAPVSPQ